MRVASTVIKLIVFCLVSHTVAYANFDDHKKFPGGMLDNEDERVKVESACYAMLSQIPDVRLPFAYSTQFSTFLKSAVEPEKFNRIPQDYIAQADLIFPDPEVLKIVVGHSADVVRRTDKLESYLSNLYTTLESDGFLTHSHGEVVVILLARILALKADLEEGIYLRRKVDWTLEQEESLYNWRKAIYSELIGRHSSYQSIYANVKSYLEYRFPSKLAHQGVNKNKQERVLEIARRDFLLMSGAAVIQ